MRRFLLNKLVQAVGPDTEPLAVRLFRLVSFITGVLCLFVFWPVNLFEPDVPQSANLVVIGVGVLALGIHWQSHKGRHLVAVLLAVIIFSRALWRNDIDGWHTASYELIVAALMLWLIFSEVPLWSLGKRKPSGR